MSTAFFAILSNSHANPKTEPMLEWKQSVQNEITAFVEDSTKAHKLNAEKAYTAVNSSITGVFGAYVFSRAIHSKSKLRILAGAGITLGSIIYFIKTNKSLAEQKESLTKLKIKDELMSAFDLGWQIKFTA